MGNAIENAIEACQRILPESERYPDKRIAIKARGESPLLVIRIENSFQPLPEDRDGYFPSSKGSRSGIGLESMRAIAEKYRGALNCERKGDTFVFSAVLGLESI